MKWIAGIVLALLVIVVVAVYILLSDKALTRIANRFADKYIAVESRIGNVHLELLKNYPLSRVELRDVSLSDKGDTLVGVDALDVSVNLKQLLKGRIIVPGLRVNRLRSAFGGGMSAQLEDIDIALRMAKRDGRPPSLRRARPEMRRVPDSLPDFLSDEDFHKSDLSISIDSSITGFMREWHPEGTVKIGAGSIEVPGLPIKGYIASFDAGLDGNILNLHSLGVKAGASQLVLSGKLKDVHRFLGKTSSLVNADLDIYAKKLDVNEIMAALDSLGGEKEKRTSPLIVVPANLIANVSLSASEVEYSVFRIDSLSAKLAARERTVQILDLRASSPMGNIGIDAFYSTRTKEDISAGFNLALTQVTAENVIELIPAVGEVLPMIQSLTGKLNCELAATAQLDSTMHIMAPTLNGVFKIAGKDLRLDEPDNFSKILRYLLFRKRDFSHIDEICVNGIVKDSKLEVLPFLLQIDKYSLGLSGTQHFDGPFQYYASLIKSPLLVRFGVRLFGDDFSRIRFRPMRSKFKKVEQIPDYSEDISFEQNSLIMSVRDVFKDAFVLPARDRLKAYKPQEEEADDELSYEEINQIELALIEMDIDDEIEAVNAEIDEFLGKM